MKKLFINSLLLVLILIVSINKAPAQIEFEYGLENYQLEPFIPPITSSIQTGYKWAAIKTISACGNTANIIDIKPGFSFCAEDPGGLSSAALTLINCGGMIYASGSCSSPQNLIGPAGELYFKKHTGPGISSHDLFIVGKNGNAVSGYYLEGDLHSSSQIANFTSQQKKTLTDAKRTVAKNAISCLKNIVKQEGATCAFNVLGVVSSQ